MPAWPTRWKNRGCATKPGSRAAHKPAPRATVPASAPAQKPGAAKPKAKKKEPAYFTAAVPGEKKPASPQPLKGAGSATR